MSQSTTLGHSDQDNDKYSGKQDMRVWHKSRSPVAWMVNNRVAANLLMLLLVVGGYFAIGQVKQETFPSIDLNTIRIQVAYPGATPDDIERGILTSIEAEVRGIDGVTRLTSQAQEGVGSVSVELGDFVDQQVVLQDVKNAVDRITTLPEVAEQPDIQLLTTRRVAMSLVVYGNHSWTTLRENAERLKQRLMTEGGLTLVEVAGQQTGKIRVSIDEGQLRALGMSLPEVAERIRVSAQDLPAGGIETTAGEILLRTAERKETAQAFESIPIVANHLGGVLTLRDVATLTEELGSSDQRAYFDGYPAIKVNVFSVGDESPVGVANTTRAFIQSSGLSSETLKLAVFEDRSEYYKGRMQLLIKNALIGLLLVLLILGIFLEAHLAFWVMLGLPISIVGAFLLFQWTGATLNMVSLFAFIITIGIVVDDAIIVGEAIYEKCSQGVSFLAAAMQGAVEMALPVTFAVVTNMIAFMPMLFIPGALGDIFSQIPAVVISVLAVSLIECLFILPAHLSHVRRDTGIWWVLNIPQRWFAPALANVIEHQFKPLIRWVVAWRYLTLALAIGAMLLTVGVLFSGRVPFTFLPQIDRDTIVARVELPYGVPIERSEAVLAVLTAAAKKAENDLAQPVVQSLYGSIGEEGGSHQIKVVAKLVPSQQRELGGMTFANLWREQMPDLPSVRSLKFSGRTGVGRGGEPIQIELSYANTEQLKVIASKVADGLAEYVGVIDINTGIELGKPQWDIELKPTALSLGITPDRLAQQIRGSFYGVEAIRFQRGEHEYKVLVSLAGHERKTVKTLESLTIKAPNGAQIPLTELATLTPVLADTEINRTEGQRVLTVTADVDARKANLDQVVSELQNEMLPKLVALYPGLTYSMEGENRDRAESMAFLKNAFGVALLGIYALLAIAFRSYLQPLAVMLSIPFGIVGAVIGHWLLGYGVSMISLIGMIGLSGIVINDALILIMTLNRYRASGQYSLLEAVVQAAGRRMRPILLTSITTFVGLMPMLFETSVQAKFLIPMAISIGFGILFATVIIVFLVPSIYMIIEDLRFNPEPKNEELKHEELMYEGRI